MVGVQEVGAAERVGEAVHPGEEIDGRRSGRRALPNTMAAGPNRALISLKREAASVIASSHEMRTQPGSRSPLGRVRRMGYCRRSAE